MFFKGWDIKNYLGFFALVIIAILVVKFVGSKLPAVGKISEKI